MDKAEKVFEKLAKELSEKDLIFRSSVTRFAHETASKNRKHKYILDFPKKHPRKANVIIVNKGRKGLLGIGKKDPTPLSVHHVTPGKAGFFNIESRQLRKVAELFEKLSLKMSPEGIARRNADPHYKYVKQYISKNPPPPLFIDKRSKKNPHPNTNPEYKIWSKKMREANPYPSPTERFLGKI